MASSDVRVVFAATTTNATETIVIHRGEPWAADDPLVLRKPELFSDDLDVYCRRSVPKAAAVAAAEEAEAVLRRGPGRPRKDGNGPWVPATDGAA